MMRNSFEVKPHESKNFSVAAASPPPSVCRRWPETMDWAQPPTLGQRVPAGCSYVNLWVGFALQRDRQLRGV